MSSGEEPEKGRRGGMGLPVQPPKPGMAMSVFVLLVGVGFLGAGAYTYVTDTAALNDRVAVTAEVTDTSVTEVETSRGRTSYVPVVRFQYQFRENSYTSNRIYPGDSEPQYEDESTAAQRLSAYPVGDRVTAYVDPDEPGKAYLEDSRSGQATGAVLVGALITLVAGVGIYQARKQARIRDLLS